MIETIFTSAKKTSKKLFFRATLGISLALALPFAQGQNYPSKPIRLVVGSPSGALGDVLARVTAQKIGESLGQPMVVDNKPGAAIAIAADIVAKAPGDGYTLLVAPDAGLVVNPFVYPKLPYDPVKDFQPIGLIGKATLVMVVSPTLGVKTVEEFIKLAKANPGKVNFATGGAGHPTHLAMELFRNRMGLDLTHVPYKGTTPAMQDIVSGVVGTMIVGVAEAMPLIKAGRVIALTASGPQAKEMFPNLPEMKSLNKDLDIYVWFGVFAPASTPKPIVSLLNNELNKMLMLPDVIKRLNEFGLAAQPGSASDVETIMKIDMARNGPLVKLLGLTAD
jgi:tripartite-type tricarboxylate transporter receptor subunit TctC